MPWLDDLADALEYPLIIAATAGAVVFVLAYTILAPWWRSREGRHLFALTLGLAALGGVSVARRFVGEWPHYTATVVLIYGLLMWELWRRVWLLLTAQHVVGGRHDDTDQPQEDT